MDESTASHANGKITLEKHIQNITVVFKSLSLLLDNTLNGVQDCTFDFLMLFDLTSDDSVDESLKINHEKLFNSYGNFINASRDARESCLSTKLGGNDITFLNAKMILIDSYDNFIRFHELVFEELRYIKEKGNNNHMDIQQDEHNNFCIYCGAGLEPGQHFCSQCGREVYHEAKPQAVRIPSKYETRIDEIEIEYDSKQKKAMELVGKSFDPTHMSYSKFSSAISKSNELFADQLEIARKMLEVDDEDNEVVGKEIENKILTLETFVDKMEDLINELVIHLSSNKKDHDDIDNLFHDMDDLIHSVKDY